MAYDGDRPEQLMRELQRAEERVRQQEALVKHLQKLGIALPQSDRLLQLLREARDNCKLNLTGTGNDSHCDTTAHRNTRREQRVTE